MTVENRDPRNDPRRGDILTLKDDDGDTNWVYVMEVASGIVTGMIDMLFPDSPVPCTQKQYVQMYWTISPNMNWQLPMWREDMRAAKIIRREESK